MALLATLVALLGTLAAPAFAQREPEFTPPSFDRTDYDLGTGPGTDSTCGNEAGELCPEDIANADFDDDGDLDLVTANRFGAGNDDITVFENDGDGGYDESLDFGGTVSTFAIDVGDFNNDDLPDVAVVDPDSTPNNVSVFLNESEGPDDFAFSAPISTPTGTAASDFAADLDVNDYNGDDNLDVAVSNNNADEVVILLGDGAGSFTEGDTIEQTTPLGLDSGDFDRDGAPDLAVTSASLITGESPNTVTTYLNDGDGNFTEQQVITTQDFPGQVTVDNFLPGRNLDLAISNAGSDSVTMASGGFRGTFRKAGSFPVGDTPYELAVGDYNRDGAPNVAVRNLGSDNVSVLTPFRNSRGQVTFVRVNFEVGQGGIDGLTSGDFDGDDVPDLSTTNFTDDSISVLLNTTTTEQ